jgi:hypothetical protein
MAYPLLLGLLGPLCEFVFLFIGILTSKSLCWLFVSLVSTVLKLLSPEEHSSYYPDHLVNCQAKNASITAAGTLQRLVCGYNEEQMENPGGECVHNKVELAGGFWYCNC